MRPRLDSMRQLCGRMCRRVRGWFVEDGVIGLERLQRCHSSHLRLAVIDASQSSGLTVECSRQPLPGRSNQAPAEGACRAQSLCLQVCACLCWSFDFLSGLHSVKEHPFSRRISTHRQPTHALDCRPHRWHRALSYRRHVKQIEQHEGCRIRWSTRVVSISCRMHEGNWCLSPHHPTSSSKDQPWKSTTTRTTCFDHKPTHTYPS